jgi:aspartate/methionine/tyrosine aminotransferase
LASLTTEGDEVILPTPWYFNHKMWLDMTGVTAVPLSTGDSLLPTVDQARALITPKTRAIALVSPNNPTGMEYPPALLEAFYLLARETGIYLILDETYRDFRKSEAPAHEIFADPDWPEALIHLYSFSKAYHLTGHRVGALATSAGRLQEIGKFIDTVTICPTGVGQAAALYGLQNLDSWLADGRQEILKRGDAAKKVFEGLRNDGWVLKSHGAYFAYVAHEDAAKHQNPARLLLDETGILFLPAHMFRPKGESGGATEFRVAFANAEVSGIEEMGRRLRDFSF